MHRFAASFAAVPSTKFRWLQRAALASALALGGAWLGACSNGGEGDRCDVGGGNLGNDECQSDLVCTKRTSLSSNPLTDICCPPNLASSTTQVCGQTVVQQFDAGVPDSATPDSGTPDASDAAATDAASDAAVDAPVLVDAGAFFGIDAAAADAATDAPLDAPSNG